MGLDRHGVNFLKYVVQKNKGKLGHVATIGRQGIPISTAVMKRLLDLPSDYRNAEYCEELLCKYLGAESVESFDLSDYEGATHIFDFNQKMTATKKYDSVIELGTIEHVFDVAQAFRNISELCKVGGRVVHVSPANNACGDGFWQISPEVCFSLYSEKNGWHDTEVFIADLNDNNHWYRVKMPENGGRASICSSVPLYLMCYTTKGKVPEYQEVQQSDYVHAWSMNKSVLPDVPPTDKGKGLKRKIKDYLKKRVYVDGCVVTEFLFYNIYERLRIFSLYGFLRPNNLSRNKNLIKLKIRNLLGVC